MLYLIQGAIPFEKDYVVLPQYTKNPDKEDLVLFDSPPSSAPQLRIICHDNRMEYAALVPDAYFPEYTEGFLSRVRDALIKNIVWGLIADKLPAASHSVRAP